MEIWDAYNAAGERIEGELVRDHSIPSGVYHLVSEVLIRHLDGSYLIMQRDFNKKGWPGYYEATAGGSALKGETALEAGQREVFEETGIHAREFHPIGQTIDQNTIYASFVASCDCAKTSVVLQKGETIAYQWLTADELTAFMDSEKCIPEQRERLRSYLNQAKPAGK